MSSRFLSTLKLSKKLLEYFPRIFLAILSGIFNQLFLIAAMSISSYMVGLALKNELLKNSKNLIILLSISIIFRIFFYFSELWLAHDVAFKILADFRVKLFNSIDRLSPSLLLNKSSGDIASTLMSDVELLEWFFAHSFGNIIVTFVVSICLLLLIYHINALFSIVLLIFIFVLISIPLILKNKADLQGKFVRENLGKANLISVEGIQGMKEIIMLDYIDEYKEKNKIFMQNLYDSQFEYGKRLGIEGALINFALGLVSISMLLLSKYLINMGDLKIEFLPVIMIISSMMFIPIIELCNVLKNFGLIIAASDRIYNILEMKPLIIDKNNDSCLDFSNIDTSIKFENVSFYYKKGYKKVLNNISFTVNKGEVVAIVGESGAGKSTCLNLLLRFWDPDEGEIYIGDKNIKHFSLENLRKFYSVVLQDSYLFNVSINENIRIAKSNASNIDIKEVCKLAFADEFIKKLSNGYDQIVGERGSFLSGGQKQRLYIARALIKNSPIMLLDEATSNLDYENEKFVQMAIKNSFKNRTTLVVSHRLKTIENADKIIFIKDGEIKEIGTHEKLIKENGFYKDMILSQKF